MLFNSLPFALFLPTVFTIYWVIGHNRRTTQNLFLILASYVFYGWWDWRFLSLIVFSSAVDFVVGLELGKTESQTRRKILLGLSLATNLGLLGTFKYFDFFADSFQAMLQSVGLNPSLPTLRLVLPVGISFYTFQTLSYSIDLYRRKIEPTKDVVAFFAYVSFFPQLVAGPIERASSLLPQFTRPRVFNDAQARDGLRQILWGFVKKVVVADLMGIYVADIFNGYRQFDGLTLVLGAIFFAVQIYCDFSGYSDIAIGTAKLFGFSLKRNFAYPYFSRTIGEFWRRWHISLSSWFRDYVYIPLGGNRMAGHRVAINIFITFGISGLWHGANRTFIVWGLFHAVAFLPSILRDHHRRYVTDISEKAILPSLKEMGQMALTFGIVCVGWVIFRAPSVEVAGSYLWGIVTEPYTGLPSSRLIEPAIIAPLIFILEWPQRSRAHGLEISHWPMPLRWIAYITLIMVILIFGQFGDNKFIYFQF